MSEKVYQDTVSIDYSLRLGEMVGKSIRIICDEINVYSSGFVEFGTITVTVETPNGTFSDKEDLMILYPLNR